MKSTTFSISGRTMCRIIAAVTRICEKTGELPPDYHVVVRAYVKPDNHTRRNHRKKFSKPSKGSRLLLDFIDSMNEDPCWVKKN